MFCTTRCICNKYDLKKIKNAFKNEYKIESFDDVIAFFYEDDSCFYIFSFGVVTFWNTSTKIQEDFLNILKPFSVDDLKYNITDEFEFENKASFKIKDDIFYIDQNDFKTKLAVSFALAQSTKLDTFEFRVEELINKTKDISFNLKEYGKIKLSSKKVAKIRGEIFFEISSVNLLLDFLGIPEFFWEYPEVEKYYIRTSKYLDVQDRVEIMNKKLEIIHEIFNMLSDEQKHAHSSFLEWIIIVLILIEIIFAWFGIM